MNRDPIVDEIRAIRDDLVLSETSNGMLPCKLRRKVHVAGTATGPDSAWMAQIARNLADCVDGFLKGSGT